jgi:hypothetical protein
MFSDVVWNTGAMGISPAVVSMPFAFILYVCEGIHSTGIIEVLDGVRRIARLFSLVVKRKPEVSIPDFGYHLNT